MTGNRPVAALPAVILLVAVLLGVCVVDAEAHAGGPTGRTGLPASAGSPGPSASSGQVDDVPPVPGDHVVNVRHAGLRRWALVHVPPAAAGSPAGAPGRRPALFHFPGMFETPEIAERSGRLTPYADRAGYLLVIPAHEGIGWQGVPGGEEAPPVDDPGFVRALADLVVAAYGADPARLYASGMSNGGLFTQVLACRARDRFAAFATVAGSAPGVGCPGPTSGGSASDPGPVPMLVIHGRDDKVISYADAEAGARAWAAAASCTGRAVATPLADTDPGDGTTVVRHDFADCPEETPVVLYEIVGGGHTWPGGVRQFPVEVLGRDSGDLDANETIWHFVSGFRLRA